MIELSKLLVNPACPIEWSHPLNQGRVGWWLRIPNSGWSGGLTYRDLVRGGHKSSDGTLTNGTGWIGSRGRRGGYGSLSFASGSSQYVDLGTATALRLTGNMSVACWASFDTYNSTQAFVSNLDNLGSNCNYQLEFGRSANKFSWIQNGNTVDFTSSNTISDTSWHHICMVRTGSTGSWTLNFYFDGRLDAGSTTVSANPGTGPGNLSLGRPGSFSAQYLNGRMDDVAIWSRGLSSSEVFALYNQSSQGHPDTLHWLGQNAWFAPVQASGGSTFNQSVSISVSDTLTFSRSIGKITSLSNTSTSTLIRSINKSVNLSISDTITKQLQISKAGSVSNTNSSSVTKSPGKVLSNNNTSTLTLANQVGKILTDSISTSNTVIKGVSKSILVSVAVVNSLEAIKAFISTLTLSVSSTATLIRQTGKAISDSVSSTLSSTRSVSKRVIVSLSSTVTQVAIRAFLATSDVIISVSNNLSRSINKVASNNSSTTPIITRSTSKSLSVSGSLSLLIVRGINKTVAKAVSITNTLTTTNIYRSVISGSVSSVSTLSRSIAKVISLTVSRTCSITKNVSKRISLSVSQLSVVGKGHSLSLSITSTITSVLNALKTVLATTYRKVFLLGKNSTNITLHGKNDTSVSNYGE